MITLHTVDLSGNGMKVRLLLSMLGLDYETRKPDMMKGEHKSPEFLELNPLGQVPVLLATKVTQGAFKVMEDRLARHDWLALGRPTIADLACYPYTALAYQGGFDLAPYKAIGAWIGRVEALPGYVGMPGLPHAA